VCAAALSFTGMLVKLEPACTIHSCRLLLCSTEMCVPHTFLPLCSEKPKGGWEVLGTMTGQELVGKTYTPLFPYFKDHPGEGGREALTVASHQYLPATLAQDSARACWFYWTSA
jgi:hypothetical protein